MTNPSIAAIREVTRALQMLLLSQLTNISSATHVTLLPPGDALPSGLGVNLYLYRVMESPFTRNRDWPGSFTSPPSQGPALGLHLSYLLTPFAAAPDPASSVGDDAHTMLGAAMLTLHENPVINNVHIPGFDADAVLPAYLLNSYEQIKITLAATSIEELSKIWAAINQPYRLSVAYDVSLVELTPTPPPPVEGGIVLSTGINVVTLSPPRLDRLTPAVGALAHVNGSGALAANQLMIAGSGFSFPGQTPAVRVGGQEATINSAPAPTDTALTVTLPTDLDAGPQADVEITLNRRTSLPLPFVATPWLASLTPIRTTLDATPGPTAPTLVLKGQGFTTTPQGVRFDGPGGTTNVTSFVDRVTDGQASVTIPTSLANGIYHVRIVLNDANRSTSNARTIEVIPLIASPIGLAVVTVSGNQVHRLTLNGARLGGGDVRLLIDGVSYQTGANANASQLVFTLGRLLTAGSHSVAVNVDGSMSHSIDLEVP
jgi:Pvc16 N-terminal domain